MSYLYQRHILDSHGTVNDHLNKFIAVISAYPLMYTSYCLVVLLKVTLSGVDPLIEAYFATDSHVFDKIPQIMLIASPV